MTSPQYTESKLLTTADHVRHGFFSRAGGVSTGEFASLNCGQFSGDEDDRVAENRKRIAASLGCRYLYSVKQVHGNHVTVVDEKSMGSAIVECDGMVTCEPGIALGVLGADCAGVLFADVKNRVIGAGHAGWKGALYGITDSVIEVMCGLGADVENIVAAIGPTIQVENYEVGNEFMEEFVADSVVECATCFVPGKPGTGMHFDLPRYLEIRLRHAGINCTDRLNLDTYSNQQHYFSYRRTCHQGKHLYGRQVSAICLVE